MNKDYFLNRAENYDGDKLRVKNVSTIANSMKQNVQFNKSMHIMDFGSGTGLLLEEIAPLVNKITAVDISASMNAQLLAKKERLDCDLEILDIDLTKKKLDKKFDGIISSMTIHHIEDVKKLFQEFYSMLNPGGFIAIADLDKEDGSFHTEDTGVFHFGFDRTEFLNTAADAGFKNLSIVSASISYQQNGEYPVFLLSGYK